MNEIRVAIVGFGGIARLHYAAYEALKKEGLPIRVAAIVERNTARVFEKVEINLGGKQVEVSEDIHLYSDVEELLASEEFDMADICLPTFLHKEMTVKLLDAGKHVLCEKPMAMNAADCREMVDAAKRNGKRLMIAHCCRFERAYCYLKQCIESGEFGALRHLTLKRLCQYPMWASDFQSTEKTGGVILDTHIHDVDLAYYLMGEPKAVSATADVHIPYWQLVNSCFAYDNATVIAEAVWDEARELPFASPYHAKFEKASVYYENEKITVMPIGGERYRPTVPYHNPFAEEIRYFAELIQDPQKENTRNSPEGALRSVAWAEKVKESASRNGETVAR